MVSSPIGSDRAAFGVSSAMCSPDWSGVTGIAVAAAFACTGAASTVNGCSKDIAMIGAAGDCNGCGAYQAAARATRLETHSVCFQSPQALFQTSKLQTSKFSHSSSHSARYSPPRIEFTISNSTSGMSPDMVTFPCGGQTGSYCNGAMRRERLRSRICAATSIHCGTRAKSRKSRSCS